MSSPSNPMQPGAWPVDPLASTASARSDESTIAKESLTVVRRHWRAFIGSLILGGALGYAGSFALTPEFTSTTTFIPPRQQSAAAAALSSLGSLAALTGAGGAVKNSAEEYVGLMQSVTVSDRIINRFGLMAVYDEKYRRDARRKLASRVQMTVGKKDGMISVSVDDEDPRRAAAMANQYVDELRQMNATLAISEAQQRRVFFEKQMLAAKERLVAAQIALQKTGVSEGAVKTEPRATADAYVDLSAKASAAEVKLEGLRASLADTAPEVRQQVALLQALRSQLDRLSKSSASSESDPDYVGRYREFKYQETLFESMAKQYELARVDESREGSLVQVVDPALPAELKSRPRRAYYALAAALLAGLVVLRLLMRSDRRERNRGSSTSLTNRAAVRD